MEREALIAAIGRTIEREVEPTAAEPTVQETHDMERIRAAASSPFAAWLAERAAAVGFGEAGQDCRRRVHQRIPKDWMPMP